MNCNIVCNRENLIKIIINSNLFFQSFCQFSCKERIITDNLHSKVNCCVCNKSSDSTKTDNSKGFSLDFRTCESTFALFNALAYIFIILDRFAPVNSLCNLTACKKKTAYNKLFNSVCVCAGCIENNNALICAVRNRDVVYACTCPCDCKKRLRHFHFVHGS